MEVACQSEAGGRSGAGAAETRGRGAAETRGRGGHAQDGDRANDPAVPEPSLTKGARPSVRRAGMSGAGAVA